MISPRRRAPLVGISVVSLMVAALLAAACSGSEQEPEETPSGTDSGAASETSNDTASTNITIRNFTGVDGVISEITDTTRIVSLGGDVTELIYELGLGDSLVGIDVTTVGPPAAMGLPSVGIARFLAPEGVLAVTPTLVLADTDTEPATALDQIRATGVPVVVFETPATFEEYFAKIADLAAVLDVSSEGQQLIERLQEEINQVTETVLDREQTPRALYLYVRGPGTLLLFGEGMTTHALIQGAGAVDVGTESGVTGYINVTPEALVAAAPDVIIVPSEGLGEIGGIDGLLKIPGIAETPARKNRAILDYPQGDFLTMGPRVPASLLLLIQDLQELQGLQASE